MATIHGQVESVTVLLSKLQGTSYTIASLEDIAGFERDYQKNYDALKEKSKMELAQSIGQLERDYNQKTREYETNMETKKEELRKERETLGNELEKLKVKRGNFFENLLNKIKYYFAASRKQYLDEHLDIEAKRIYRHLAIEISDIKIEWDDKKENTQKWLDELTQKNTEELRSVQKEISENAQLLADAHAQQQAVEMLATLPDQYVIINDYNRKFFKPFHRKMNNDWIYSVQIDHIVIGPTGLFLLETTNWNDESQPSSGLSFPIEQLQRFNYVLSVILNQAVNQGDLPPFRPNMTPRTITPKNILLLTEHKPAEEIQNVPLKLISEINGYLTQQKVHFSNDDIECLTTFLLNKDTASGYQDI
jgi:hypothetical protein